jgi:hypothetical protein
MPSVGGRPFYIYVAEAITSSFLPGVVATDLDTEHGGTDANKRDGARQLGRLNVDDLQL